jgi:hypothetical protein
MQQSNVNAAPEIPMSSSVPPVTVNTTVPETPPIMPSKPKKNWVMLSLIAVIIVLLIVAGGVFVLLRKNTTTPIAQKTNIVVSSPSPTPVTSNNVDAVLNNTDTSMQQSIDQANTDLNQISNINTSQDTNTGL